MLEERGGVISMKTRGVTGAPVRTGSWRLRRRRRGGAGRFAAGAGEEARAEASGRKARKLQKLERQVARLAPSEDLAGGDIEASEKSGGAVTDAVVGDAFHVSEPYPALQRVRSRSTPWRT